jgi:hypothetical protein
MPNESSTADQAVLTHNPALPLDIRVPALSEQGRGHGTITTATTSTATTSTTGGTLDLSQFNLVWDHNFSTNHSFSPELTRDWGNVSLTSIDATLTSTLQHHWPHAGMMQPPTGAAAGNGYGLYSVTAQIDPNEGPGAYIVLWPATDQWPGPELDLVEKANTSNTSGYSTIHWKDPTTGQDAYHVTTFPGIDVSQKHTYAMDWEAGHISLYIDNNLIYTTTDHVPLDYADGGQNESFGAGMQPYGKQNPDHTNVLHVYDMSYSSHSPIA